MGIFDPDYVWHDMAQVWQTPGAGEELVEGMLGPPLPERSATLVALGISESVAADVAAAQGPEMGRAILALYRSAAQPVLVELSGNLQNAASRPGLTIVATEDPYVGTSEMKERAAQRAGARVEVLEASGTGGCCRTRPAGRRCSPGSGVRWAEVPPRQTERRCGTTA